MSDERTIGIEQLGNALGITEHTWHEIDNIIIRAVVGPRAFLGIVDQAGEPPGFTWHEAVMVGVAVAFYRARPITRPQTVLRALMRWRARLVRNHKLDPCKLALDRPVFAAIALEQPEESRWLFDGSKGLVWNGNLDDPASVFTGPTLILPIAPIAVDVTAAFSTLDDAPES